ncbi:MAG: lytic transglycosylase domain-containing protein [Rhodobacteraceae bacterium]|nr:lytic transglycosylase domain-containing protein [Paracoccaceae bacterium]
MIFRIFATATLALMLGFCPALAQSPEEDGAILVSALAAADSDDWLSAVTIAERLSDPVAVEIIDWMRLRAGEGTFAEYEFFLTENADWPGLKLLQKIGERTLPENLSPARVLAYFSAIAPQTGLGVIRYAAAQNQLGRADEARQEVVRAWLGLTLTPSELAQLSDEYNGFLAEYHAQRLDWLLWEGQTKAAEAMYDLVSEPQKKLAEARIGLQRAVNGVDALIAAVPASLTDDAGLAFDRFIWRVKKGYWDSANEMLNERTSSADALGRPAYWANRRRTFARRAMRLGDFDEAYRLASQHYLTEGSNYADLEWLAGFLALKKMDDPARALTHFQNFRAAIRSPISVGRAGYWLGLTHEALGDAGAAQAAYAIGAAYQTSFYGQLAAERAGIDADARLRGYEMSPDWTVANFLTHESVRAGVLFYFAEKPLLARRFFSHESETLDPDAQEALGQLALDLELPNTALSIAKIAARSGTVLPDAYYPVTELASYSVDIPAELAMAIARQESELYVRAQSPAGARGLMQIMPATARQVAGKLGIEYSHNRLLNDWRYNARLGTAYLAELIVDFDGSYLLAVAAYNAGPTRVRQWIKDYGDPRHDDVDPVVWIETIPYRETRNYVQRVMEALFVYRARISGEVPDLMLESELAHSTL